MDCTDCTTSTEMGRWPWNIGT